MLYLVAEDNPDFKPELKKDFDAKTFKLLII